MDDAEDRRQHTIAQYQLGGQSPEPEFDAVTQMAAELFGVPMAAVTVLDRERQIFQSACGLDRNGTPRRDAFCNFTAEGHDVFVVEDARDDPRFRDNPLVTGEPHIRFYAGAPVRLRDGIAVGALCLLDRRTRTFSPSERRRLRSLADIVAGIAELRLGSRLGEERRAELQVQTELLRATVDSVQQGLAVADAAGTMILSNSRLFELLNLQPDDWPAGHARSDDLLAAASQAGWYGADGRSALDLLGTGGQTSGECHELRNGSGQVLEACRLAIPGARSILIVQDITERRQMVRMKDEFISTVSHELRTPLTSIRGALLVLGRKSGDSLDEQGRKMVEMASRNAERLANLVNDILDVEKLGSGALTVSVKQIDLANVLRDACDQLRPFAASHQVDIALECDEVMPAIGDPGRLQQAVTNLISNACKFSPQESVVRVTGHVLDGQAKITVADSGPGIPAEFRSRIFRRFAQANPEHRSGSIGTGLGLAITKAIVDQHGGEIGYESEAGQGTCFWMILPREQESDA